MEPGSNGMGFTVPNPPARGGFLFRGRGGGRGGIYSTVGQNDTPDGNATTIPTSTVDELFGKSQQSPRVSLPPSPCLASGQVLADKATQIPVADSTITNASHSSQTDTDQAAAQNEAVSASTATLEHLITQLTPEQATFPIECSAIAGFYASEAAQSSCASKAAECSCLSTGYNGIGIRKANQAIAQSSRESGNQSEIGAIQRRHKRKRSDETGPGQHAGASTKNAKPRYTH